MVTLADIQAETPSFLEILGLSKALGDVLYRS